ncbi:WYL domain-containing protein [uncultured Vibrio sp.]|uniref:helix-turn-helix transcriptional regulator n=1 Tax=uncultured Vibrio sp. TaxID=114054 RepID=UPI00260DAB6A|nr:WYL domain-containing protein [uncultured Vibrio sp.]
MSKTTHVSTRQHMVLALELYKRIPYGHKVTASKLKAHLEEVGIHRDIRTIQRNLDVLLEYFDIERDDRDKPYGYQRKQHKALIGFTIHEALLLCLAESHIHYLIPPNVSNTLHTLFEDANYRLRSLAQDSKESQWLKKVAFQNTAKLSKNISADIYAVIGQGLYHNRWLSLQCGTKESPHRKNVMPLGLVQQSNTLMLVCYKQGAKNTTFIDIGQVHKATLSTFIFDYPRDFDLHDELTAYTRNYYDSYTIEFTITKQAGEHLYHAPLSEDQCILDQCSLLHVTATVSNTLPFMAWLEAHKKHITSVKKVTLPSIDSSQPQSRPSSTLS